MISTNINNIDLVLYDSIDNMPIVNYTTFNRFMLIDSGIGGSFEDIDSHIVKIAKLISTDSKLAIQELQNMRQSMYMVLEGINPKYMAFACFIYKIDGERFTDLTDSGIKSVLLKLNKAKHSIIVELFNKLKKNIDLELNTYFKEIFDSSREKEIYTLIKQRTELVLDSVINDTKNATTIDEIDSSLLLFNKPKQFAGAQSVEVLYTKQFEDVCVLISHILHLQAKQLTVFEFYTAILRLKKNKNVK